MLRLIRAEWLKLTKRPLTKVLLGIFLAGLVLQIFANFALVLLFTLRAAPNAISTGPNFLSELPKWTQFPGLFGFIFSQINGVGGVFAIILTASAMGNEYSWGTLRTQLARQPSRERYLFAKLVTLMALLLLAMVVSMCVGSLCGGALAVLGGRFGELRLADVLALPLALLRALYIFLPYVLLTICFTIITRSPLLGAGGGVVYLAFEFGFGALTQLFEVLGDVWVQIYNLTIQQNITALTVLNGHTFGLESERMVGIDPARLPSPLQATVVVAVYCISFWLAARYWFLRRDITGAV